MSNTAADLSQYITRLLGATTSFELKQKKKRDFHAGTMATGDKVLKGFFKAMVKNDKKTPVAVEKFIESLKTLLQLGPGLSLIAPIIPPQVSVTRLLGQAFQNAVHAGLTEQMKTFLQAAPKLGVDPKDLINSSRPNTGSTALHIYTIRRNKEMVKYLIENGANPNQVNKFGDTPLLIACTQQDPASVKLLIKAKADPNYRIAKLGNATIFSSYVSGIKNYDQDSKTILDSLLSAKPDVNAQNEHGNTALISAALDAPIEVLALILKQPSIKINHQNNERATALAAATHARSLESMQLLIDAGADPNLGDILTAPLFLSVALQFEQGSKLLLETRTIDVNRKVDRANTPLMHMAIYKQLETMKLLFEMHPKVEVNCKNEKGASALVFAVKHGHLEVVEFLLAKNADPTIVIQSCTLLHMAATEGFDQILKCLLKIPALLKNIDAEASNGWSAIFQAMSEGQVACTRLLLEQGASLEKGGKAFGLAWVAGMGNSELVSLFLNYQPEQAYQALIEACKADDENTVRILLQSQHINIKACHERFGHSSLLHIAAGTTNNPKIIELLLQAGFNPKAVDKEGRTPLHYAAYKGHQDVIPLLLAVGADINAASQINITPLINAAFNNQIEAVKTLLKFKPDIHAKVKLPIFRELTAIEVTTSAEIIELLKAAGCQEKPFTCYMIAGMLMEQEGVTADQLNSLVPALDLNEDIYCGRYAAKRIPLYILINGLNKINRALAIKLFLAARLKTENFTKEQIDFAVDVLIKSCSDYYLMENFDLCLQFARQKTKTLTTICISMQEFIDSVQSLEGKARVTSQKITEFSEKLWSFTNEAELDRIKQSFCNLQEKTLNAFSQAMELCQRDLATLNLIERQCHQYSLEFNSKTLADCQSLFSEIKTLKELFSAQDLKVSDFNKNLSKECKELLERFEKLSEIMTRYHEKITLSMDQLKEKIIENQERKSKGNSRKAKKRGKRKQAETGIPSSPMSSAPRSTGEKYSQGNSKFLEGVQKEIEELKKIILAPPKKMAMNSKREPIKASPEVVAEIKLLGNSFMLINAKLNGSEQDFEPLRRPKPLTLDVAAGQLSSRLRAIEGRNILQTTSHQAKLVHSKDMSAIELLIQVNAMKGALAQALESRKGLKEDWPNDIRNLIFHHEKMLDKYSNEELVARIELFNQNLESIKENDLIKDKEKLKLQDVDSDDFFGGLLQQKAEAMTVELMQAEIERSEVELDCFKSYLQERGFRAIDSNLKMAIGFALARIGTFWNKISTVQSKVPPKYAQCPYREWVVFGKEYRHMDPEWTLKVNTFIKSCLTTPSLEAAGLEKKVCHETKSRDEASRSVQAMQSVRSFNDDDSIAYAEPLSVEAATLLSMDAAPLIYQFAAAQLDSAQFASAESQPIKSFAAKPGVLDISSGRGDRKTAS